MDNKYELVKKIALISDGVELADSEKFGLHWFTNPSAPSSGTEDPSDGDHNIMWVQAQNLQPGEDVSLHCQSVLNAVAMQHKKAAFVCFEIAVHGTRKKFAIKSNKKQSKVDTITSLMKNATITGRRRSQG